MEFSDKVNTVGAMQRYINAHLNENITLEHLADVAGYSKYHAARMFKELTGRAPFETIRALRMTYAAQTLQTSDEKILDVAMGSGFD
ncbi:MAG: AraC family transcriptional regulator, partial [Oscillospiraceae bacterium]|nr:AraC family transcriptional regulator [Oscillospiraceae bacterium]